MSHSRENYVRVEASLMIRKSCRPRILPEDDNNLTVKLHRFSMHEQNTVVLWLAILEKRYTDGYTNRQTEALLYI